MAGRAARAAALLKKELDLDATLVHGRPGEFRVLVGEDVVAKKNLFGFVPGDQAIVARVRAKLGR
jgi:hypothetical protein